MHVFGPTAQMQPPQAVAVDSLGNVVFSDEPTSRIMRACLTCLSFLLLGLLVCVWVFGLLVPQSSLSHCLSDRCFRLRELPRHDPCKMACLCAKHTPTSRYVASA